MKTYAFEKVINKYRSLKEPHKNIVNNLEDAKKEIWENSTEYSLFSKIDNLPAIGCGGYCLFICVFFLLEHLPLIPLA